VDEHARCEIVLAAHGPEAVPVRDAGHGDGPVQLLDVEQEVCTDTFTAVCINLGCQERVFPCQLPSLAAGDWVITIPGTQSRLLRVQPGGVASCRFIVPQVP